MSEIAVTSRVDRRLYSLHEEEDVVEIPRHRKQVFYIENNLRTHLAGRFVGGNMAIYWVPGQREHPWVGPDVFVSERLPAEPEPRVYVVDEDGPVRFVAEVASDRTRRAEKPKRERIYRTELQIPEYLYIDLDRHQLELWRLHEGEYHPVSAEGGRLYSQEVGHWFGWQNDRRFVRIWTPDGRMLLTQEEEQQRAEEAERRAAAAEARAAELAAELERLRRGGG